VADVDGEHLAAGALDAGDDFLLHAQGSDEPVEVGGDDHVSPAVFDHLDGAT
jgi:hypothetical protein